VESVSKKFWSGNEIREGFLRFFEARAPAGAELVARTHGEATLLLRTRG